MWQSPPDFLNLPGDAIHVWRADLRVSPPCFRRLESTLSPDECARAARFHFPEHRERFTAAHGVLRDVLSRYLDVPAAQLAFAINAYGKPALASPDHAWLQFNLSHSGDLALVAVTRDRSIGIDVERIAPPDNLPRLMEQFFSESENAAFRALPEGKREAAFFAGWTRKEAYIKALGVGASLPLHQFDVTLHPDEPARLLADRANPGNVARWSLLDLDVGPDYAAALAVYTPPGPVTCWQWDCRLVVG